jgi:group I intron endonuclease
MTAKTGIYLIESICKPDKFYIGSAVDISKRWERHLSELRKGKHGNRHMQNHFDKYGENDFRFGILEECEHIKLLRWEQWWIDETQPTFNICADAGSRFGVVCSFATRERIKRSVKNRPAISMLSRLKKNKLPGTVLKHK